MVRYLAVRAVQAVIVAFLISLATFFLLFVAGNPVHLMVGEAATTEQIAQLSHQMGLDRPILQRYLLFAGGMLRGDFGESLFMRGRPALGAVLERLPATLDLAAICLTTTAAAALALGIAAAARQDGMLDYAVSLGAAIAQGIPSFWLGIAFIMIFSVRLHWLPFAGIGSWKHLVMPCATLDLYLLPTFVRLVRSRFIDVLREDYVRTARAKGVANARLYLRHVLRNASAPIVAALGLQLGHFFSGVVVVETIFGWPGAASLIVSSVAQFDYPVVQAGVVIVALIIAAGNLLADTALLLLDPRVSYGSSR
jgi:ABC-type dipeptide/oligopeptide/nickel transport system permease component